MTRATESVPLPAAKGTIKLIGFDGQASWADKTVHVKASTTPISWRTK
jgi:hypothetical protein